MSLSASKNIISTGLAMRGGKNTGEKERSENGVFAEKDATIDFEDVGHSDSAIEMMQKYFVGELDTSTLPAKVNYSPPPPTQAPAFNNQSSGFVVKTLQFLVPLVILGLAFALQFYGKRSKSNDS